MTQTLFNLVEAKRDWCSRNASEVIRLMRGRNSFSTDDLHGVIEEPEHANWFGVLLAKLKSEGSIEYVRHFPSSRKEANGRKISHWFVKV